MKTVASLLILLSILCVSATYADNFHIKNHSNRDVVAAVYFHGKKETTLTLKPGQEYVHDFWHNLVVKVILFDPTAQRSCSIGMEERCYYREFFTDICKYEPRITDDGGTGCQYYSTFVQSNWQTHDDTWQKFSYVDVWAPWTPPTK